MKKTTAIIGVIIVIMAFFAVNTFAVDKAPIYGNIENGKANNLGTGVYGGILTGGITGPVEALNYYKQDNQYGIVGYSIRVNVTDENNTIIIYLPYETDRYLPNYDARAYVSGTDETSKVVSSIVFSKHKLFVGNYTVFTRNFFGPYTYNYDNTDGTQDCLQVTIYFQEAGQFELRIGMQFSDYENPKEQNNNNLYSQLYQLLYARESDLNTIGGIISQIYSVQWIQMLVILNAMLIVMGIVINLAKSL